jgi:hypothetical protein
MQLWRRRSARLVDAVMAARTSDANAVPGELHHLSLKYSAKGEERRPAKRSSSQAEARDQGGGCA